MNNVDQLLVFALDDQYYALRLDAVERVVRAVEVTPLPDAPEIVRGIINVQGRIVPVIDLRRCFHFPEREIRLSDQFVVSSAMQRTVAFAVDAVHGVVHCPEEAVVPVAEILSGVEAVEGVVKLTDGMVLIPDIDKVFSPGDETRLDEGLAGLGDPGPEAGDKLPERENGY
ncbi:MAG: chemotaxis protein CheW [Desulfurivibrionaceae bacterium]